MGIVEGPLGTEPAGSKFRYGTMGVGTRGKYFESQCVNGHRRPVPGAPSSGGPPVSQAKFRDGTKLGW